MKLKIQFHQLQGFVRIKKISSKLLTLTCLNFYVYDNKATNRLRFSDLKYLYACTFYGHIRTWIVCRTSNPDFRLFQVLDFKAADRIYCEVSVTSDFSENSILIEAIMLCWKVLFWIYLKACYTNSLSLIYKSCFYYWFYILSSRKSLV